jgi:hypothetical protein
LYRFGKINIIVLFGFVMDVFMHYRFAFGEAFDPDPAFCLHRCYINITLMKIHEGLLTDRKLVIQNKRDVSTNTKQLYYAFCIFLYYVPPIYLT